MKNTVSKMTAGLLAAVMCLSVGVSGICASAAEEKEEDPSKSIILPSGYSLAHFLKVMELTGKTDDSLSGFASAAAAVFHGDETLYEGYHGYADIENEIPADENTVYEWGSISKTMVWVSAMQLWEQGRLDLDRDVREYLPDGFFRHLAYDEPITMLNLMNHNAGWQETTRPIWKTEESEICTLKDELQAIEPVQVSRPGEICAYSNYGAAVAGYVVECISGMDYCEYVHENILEPLGMEHTAINPAHSDNAFVYDQRKKVKSYTFKEMLDVTLADDVQHFVGAYPAGAVTGTLRDMVIYGQALVNDDAPLFRNPETQKIMFTGTDFYGDSDIPTCAHGFWTQQTAVQLYGHSGATLFGIANLLIDPAGKYGFAVMCNQTSANWYYEYLPTMLFGILKPDVYGSKSTGTANLNSGEYVAARGIFSGMLRYASLLASGSVSGEQFENVQVIDKNVVQIVYPTDIEYRQELGMEEAEFLGLKEYADGRTGLQAPSCDYLLDRWHTAKLVLFAAYFLLAVISVYMVLIRRTLKKGGKWVKRSGGLAVGVSDWLRIVSVAGVLVVFTMAYKQGITQAQETFWGIVQIICATGFCAAGIGSLAAVFSKNTTKWNNICNILSTVCNAVMVGAIVYFELYKFWI